jgi:sulfonate transport system substrate-binding protein
VTHQPPERGFPGSPAGNFGDVAIEPTTPNSAAVLQFESGQIQGGSEPSPYDVEMVQDGGVRVLSEPGVTTLLVVTQSFQAQHPSVVNGLLEGQIQATDYIAKNPVAAQAVANAELTALEGKGIKPGILPTAFREIHFTNNPDTPSLTQDAKEAESLSLLSPVDLNGIFDLGPLNTLLKKAGEPQVSS